MIADDDETFILLDTYVLRVNELCEGLERDIIKGSKISSDTVLRLSRLISAASAASSLIKPFDGSGEGSLN